ncbi:MAG: leukotoxin LktA family filamentous adhesin, partial [Endomicrobium sp.]|nr:leukotoxin LktA family filamentous adhesin [Endomicrobium sp.]
MKKKIVAVFSAVLFAFAQTGFAQMIVTDGKTDTSVLVNGNVSDVHTNTSSGNTAFNSFKQFDVYLNNTVNLHLKNGINNLVNLVSDKTTNIDGVLNAYKNGKIGGNVFFLNPNGIIIGKSGIVNVGALTLAAPTKEFMDSIINSDRSVSSLITKAILAGDIPINPAGTISIKGKINADDGVGIKGGDVNIAKSGEIKTIKPSDIANTQGIEETEVFVKDGQIVIGAKNDFINEGKISAGGADISITAGNNTDLKNGSVISSNGLGADNAGNIYIWADNDSYLRDGALVSATAQYGDGGFVEFSAKNSVFLEGWGLAAYSLYGKGGTVFIDPTDLVISVSTNTLGANYIMDATNSIMVNGGVAINTTKSGDSAGNISLQAPNITLGNNVSLTASAGAGKNAGNITLQGSVINIGNGVTIDASNSADAARGGDILIEAIATAATPWIKSATASINIGNNSAIKGKNITIHSLASSQINFEGTTSSADWEQEDAPADIQSAITTVDTTTDLNQSASGTTLDFLDDYGLIAMAGIIDLTSSITIGAGAQITATNDLFVKSEIDSQLKLMVPFVNLAVAYGKTKTNSLIDIKGGAVLSGGKVEVNAYTNTSLDLTAMAMSNASVGFGPADGAVSIGIMDASNKVKIAAGAQLNSGTGGVSVSAKTDKSMKVSASASAMDSGVLAAAAAVSLSNVDNEVDMNGRIVSGGATNISSVIDSADNRSVSSAGAGDSQVTYYVNKGMNFVSQKSKLANLFHKGGEFETQSHSSFGAAASVAYSEHTNKATAKVGSNADIMSEGNIDIKAEITENRIRHAANASVDSVDKTDQQGQGEGYTKQNGGAAAVAISEYNNNVTAYINDGAQLDSKGNITVESRFLLPYEITWHQINGLSDITSKLNGNLGIQNGFFTTWANSTVSTNQEGGEGGSQQGDVAFAASFNMAAFNSSSKAYIGKNVKINKRLAQGDTPGKVSVIADSSISTLNYAGNMGLLFGATDAKTGIGAGMVWISYDNKTESYIDDGADIKASSIDVKADSAKRDITLAVSGNKKAESFGFNGVFNWVENNSLTLAHISASARLNLVNNGALNVSAFDDTQLFNIAGGLLRMAGSKNVGIGAAVALIDSTRVTKAYIGSDEDENAPMWDEITAGNVTVSASNEGDIYAVSLAASVQAGSGSQSEQAAQDDMEAGASQSQGGGGGYGIGVSGDISITDSQSEVKAFVNGANIIGNDISIDAQDSTQIYTVSGSAALELNSDSKTSVGIAGSASVNTIENQVAAFVKNAHINSSKLNVNAKNDSYILSIAASGSAAPVSKNGISVAGSVAINEIDNSVSAFADFSTITAADDKAEFKAQDASEIIAVAGGVSVAKTVGIGASVGINNINNAVSAYLKNASVNAPELVVSALNDASLIAVSGTIGAALEKMAAAVSVAIAEIDNDTQAYIIENSNIEVSNTNVSVSAENRSEMTNIAGAVGVGKEGGVGIATAVSKIYNDTKAYASGSTIKANSNIVFSAVSQTETETAAASGSAGLTAGVSGSVAVNDIDTNTSAYVVGNSNLEASGSIKVSALSNNIINFYGGMIAAAGKAGFGATVAVNSISNNVSAFVENSIIKVLGNFVLKDFAGADKRGLLVESKVNDDVNVYSVNIGAAGNVGVAADVTVNNIESAAQTSLKNTAINQGVSDPTLHNEQGVYVTAENYIDVEVYGGSLGAGGNVGVGAVSDTTFISNAAKASVTGSNIKAKKDVTVKSKSIERYNAIVLSGAGAGTGAGIAGNVVVLNIENDNQALLDNSSVVSGGAVVIEAEDNVKVGDKNGGIGVGAGALALEGAGIAGAVFVVNVANATKAIVKNSTVNAAGAIKVLANAVQKVYSYLPSLAGAGVGAGIAASVGVVTLDSETLASVEETSGNNTVLTSSAAGDAVIVKAASDSLIQNIAATLGAGIIGAGVGASVLVSKINGKTSAQLGSGVTVSATNGKAGVIADNKRSIDDITAAMGAGAAGVSGSVSVAAIGSNLNEDDLNSASDAKSVVEEQLAQNSNITADMLGNDRAGLLSGTDASNMAQFQADVNSAFDTQSAQDKGTSAIIGANASITSQNLDVDAKDVVSVTQTSGSGAVGMGLSLGVSVAIANVNSLTRAVIGDNAFIQVNGNVNVSAKSDISGDILSVMGAAGLSGVAAGGAIAIFNSNNTTESYISDNAAVRNALKLNVTAESVSDIDVQTVGVTAGLGAAGASVARINKTGDTLAYTKNNVELGLAAHRLGNVEIKAKTSHNLFAQSEAGAAGIGAASGNDARVNADGKVWAFTGTNNKINANSVNINTDGNITAKAKTYGVNVGALAAGVSIADVFINLDNEAVIGQNNNVKADDVTVAAAQNSANAEIDATSAVGALLSANGAQSNSAVQGNVTAAVRNNADIDSANITVKSSAKSRQEVNADAYTAGAIGVGLNTADVSNTVTSSVDIASNSVLKALRTLSLSALSDHATYAQSYSGNYGGINGSGAVITNTNNSKSYINIGAVAGAALTLAADTIELIADNIVKQDSKAAAVTAGLVGATSLNAHNSADIDAKIEISGNSTLTANDLELSAKNTYDKSYYAENIKSTAGGIVEIDVSESATGINASADIILNNNVKLNTIKRADGSSSFVAEAFNDVTAKDKGILTSGGLLMVPNLNSSITNNSYANIKLYGAKINTAGNAIFNVKSDADIESAAQISVYGASGIANGQSRALNNIYNVIEFYNGAEVYAKGNIILGLTQPYGGTRSHITSNALTDIYNRTGIPIDTGSEAHGELSLNNIVDVKSGAVLRSAGEINIDASYSIAESAGLLYIYSATDDIQLATKEGATSATTNEMSVVNVDGSLLSGVNNIFNATINNTGTLESPNYQVTGAGIDDVGYTITDENLANNILREIERYQELADTYAMDPVLKGAYEAEVARLRAEYEALGLIDENGLPISASDVKYITFNDINANRGEININADNLTGSGTISAQGYAEIKITNNSDLFLRLNDATIADSSKGDIFFNGVLVENNSDINNINAGASAQFSSVYTSGNTEDPVIELNNTYSYDGRGAYLEMQGDILNRDGSFTANSVGSIYAKGNINARDIHIHSDADVVQSYTDGFRHIGGDPESHWASVASSNESSGSITPGTVYDDNSGAKSGQNSIIGNNVFISGRYLNINGAIQAGVADWTLNVADDDLSLEGGFTVLTAIADYQSKIANNQPATPLYALDSSHGNIKAYYNVLTNEIILEDISVQGGRLELYGHILNTGGSAGSLTALDGYGKINIVNDSSYGIQLGNIYNDNKVEGIIRITDTAFQNANNAFLVTEYTRNNGQVVKTQQYSDGTTGSNSSTTSAYKPLANQRYMWTTGTTASYTEYYSHSSNSFWGMDFLVPDTSLYNYRKGPEATSPLPDGNTVIVDPANGNSYSYLRSPTHTVSSEKTKDRRWTETHGWWIFSTTEYHHELEYRTGTIRYNTHSVKADYDIGINFVGYSASEAETRVTANNNLLLNGTIRASEGTVNLASENGAIDNLGSGMIYAKDIVLSAATGIGDNLPLDIMLTNGNITASSTDGDIDLNFRGLNYVVNLNGITAGNGNVKLTSENTMKTVGTTAVTGSRVDVTSNYGDIGGNDVFNIQADTLKALAQNDINIEQKSGDLGLVSVESLAGDVTLKVAGNITDANEEESIDQRTAAQLLSDWNSLNLFNQTYGDGLDDSWTPQQLLYAVSATSLKNTVDTQYQNEAPNVIGKNVDIQAGGSVGLDMGYVDIDISDYANVSDADKLLISSAESDNLLFTFGQDGVTPVSVRVYRTEDVDINADSLTLTANGYVYIGGDQDININRVQSGAGEDITIYAKGGIYNVNPNPSAANIIGGNVIFEAGSGSIGLPSKDLVLNVTGKILARAQNGIYLYSGSNGFIIDSLLSKGLTRLTTTGDITAYNSDTVISSEGVQLSAVNIGSDLQALGIILTQENAAQGTHNAFAANAGGKINVASKGANIFYTGNITAAGNVKITSESSLFREGDTKIKGANINFAGIKGNIGASDNYTVVESAGNVSANADNDIYLKGVGSSSFSGVSSLSGGVNLTGLANTSVNNVSANTGINVVSNGTLNASGGISSTNSSVSLTSEGNAAISANISAKTEVEITSGGAIETSGSITSTNSSAALSAQGDIETTGTITAKEEITADSAEGNLLIGNEVTSTDSSVALTAQGDIETTGTITAKEEITVDSAEGNLSIGNEVTSTDSSVSLIADGDATVSANVSAKTEVEITSGGALETSGSITSTDSSAALTAQSDIETTGDISAKEEVTVVSNEGKLTIDNEVTSTNANVSLTAQGDVEATGKINAKEEVTIDSVAGNLTINS